jgi:mevalonate kinase
MKKIVIFSLIFTCVAFFVIFSSCSREKAMEQLMADPQMSQLIMQKIWETPETKEQLVQMVMEDPESMNKLRESLVADSAKATQMLDMILANEDLEGMIKEKTADLHKKKRR